MVGLRDVYKIDPMTDEILGLEDISSTMAPTIPKCPHCQCPIRQYVTQRYNRLINRAVIDEMSKRFIVTGQTELREVEENLIKLDLDLEKSRSDVTRILLVTAFSKPSERAIKGITQKLDTRYTASDRLLSTIRQLQRRAAERHQPAHKLYEATIHALQQDTSLENKLATLRLEHNISSETRDERITIKAKLLQAKVESLTLEDRFHILSDARVKYSDPAMNSSLSQMSPSSLIPPFLQFCADLISTCIQKSLPRLAVEASIYYARIARLFETSGITEPQDREKATEYRNQAKTLLTRAAKLCEAGFSEADRLLQAVNEALKLLRKEWYEEVTPGELVSIKAAMVSGAGGIATHSGHWYNCVNGHPVGSSLDMLIAWY
jgi:hypothetical protein